MQMMTRVGWLLWILALMSVTNAMGIEPSYIKLRPGTLAVGGVDDLRDEDGALILAPATCLHDVFVHELDIGFLVEANFNSLVVAGLIEVPKNCKVEVLLKNFGKGKYDFLDLLDLADPIFASNEIPVDSTTYREHSTLEVEVRVSIHCPCAGPPTTPTEKDDVSVQKMTLGPKP